jgi:hypothetical protein
MLIVLLCQPEWGRWKGKVLKNWGGGVDEFDWKSGF